MNVRRKSWGENDAIWTSLPRCRRISNTAWSVILCPTLPGAYARLSNGGLRDAETLLDQLSLRDDAITPEMVRELVGSVREQDLLLLLNAIALDDSKELLVVIRQIL